MHQKRLGTIALVVCVPRVGNTWHRITRQEKVVYVHIVNVLTSNSLFKYHGCMKQCQIFQSWTF